MNTKTARHSLDMLHGSLIKKILLFALPIAASSILQQLFNSADTAVAGQFGNADALAAVGTNGEIVALIVGICVGIAVGANVLIAKFIGAGERHRISGAVHTAMAFSVVFGILFTILGQFTARPLLALIHTPEDIMTSATNYLKVYFLGVPFLSVYNFGSAILRSKGDSKRPLAALILSGIINVLLNLFFVVVCKLSVIGVALATDISTAVSAFFVVFWLCREPDEFRLSVRKCRIEWKYLSSILRIGIPAAIQSAVFCVANIFVQSAINTFGSSAAAGSAISMNFEYIAYYVNIWTGSNNIYQSKLCRQKDPALPENLLDQPRHGTSVFQLDYLSNCYIPQPGVRYFLLFSRRNPLFLRTNPSCIKLTDLVFCL